MKLTVFFSVDGDCILITGADGKMVLADGGRSASYSKHVAPKLNELLEKGGELEAVYISHIDADHVEGIEKMLQDLVKWAAHDFRKKSDPNDKKPTVLRPMKPKAVWHNSFHDQVEDNEGKITDLLAASAAVFTGMSNSATPEMRKLAADVSNLATSTRQALNISLKLRKNLLNIKLNPEFQAKLMILNSKGKLPEPIEIGGMIWRIIGPGESQLDELRKDWNAWLNSADALGEDGKIGDLEKVKKEIESDKKSIGNSATEVSLLSNGRARLANNLAQAFLNNEIALRSIKGRDKVTIPNLASLMFLVEEKKGKETRRLLMTGDGHWQDILDGLKRQNLYDKDGNLHVNVLKIQHHGAFGNAKPAFFKLVTADHYIFCGVNDHHKNPEKQVVEDLLNSRLIKEHQGTHEKVKGKFKISFNASSSNPNLNAAGVSHIKMIEEYVAEQAKPSRFTAFFLDGSSFPVDV